MVRGATLNIDGQSVFLVRNSHGYYYSYLRKPKGEPAGWSSSYNLATGDCPVGNIKDLVRMSLKIILQSQIMYIQERGLKWTDT